MIIKNMNYHYTKDVVVSADLQKKLKKSHLNFFILKNHRTFVLSKRNV